MTEVLQSDIQGDITEIRNFIKKSNLEKLDNKNVLAILENIEGGNDETMGNILLFHDILETYEDIKNNVMNIINEMEDRLEIS